MDHNRDKDGNYFRGTFTDEAKAKAKAAAIGGFVSPWFLHGKPMFTVKSKTLEN